MEWLLAALLGGFLGFNALATPDRAAKTMEASLRKTYPQATVNATVEGKKGRAVLKGNFRRVRIEMSHIGAIDELPFSAGAASKLGYLGRLELVLNDFRFSGLPVQSSEFIFNDVAYDFNALKKDSKLSIAKCGAASAKIVLNNVALQQRFSDSLDGVTNMKISLHNGLLQMDAKKTLPLIRIGVPFHLTAQPIVKNGNEIWLTNGRLSFENTTGLNLRVNNLLADLNPIYVFDPQKKWPFRVNLTSVVAQNNSMLVNANLVFVGAPKVAAPSVSAVPMSSVLPAIATISAMPASPSLSQARETAELRAVLQMRPATSR